MVSMVFWLVVMVCFMWLVVSRVFWLVVRVF